MEEDELFKRIDHVEIIPSNIDKTIDFYTNILGFKIKERFRVDRPPLAEIAFLQLNDSMIELLSFKNASPPAVAPQVGFRMMAIEVDDMDKTIAYLDTKGVKITNGPRLMGKSKRAEIKDPDGLAIELRQW